MAARSQETIDALVQRLEEQGYSITHSGVESTGFSTDLRLTIEALEMRWGTNAEGGQLETPLLRINSPIWNPGDIRFTAPSGIVVSLRAEERMELSAATLHGSLHRERDLDDHERWSLQGRLSNLEAEAPWSVQPLATARTAAIAAIIPEALLLSKDAVGTIQVESRLDDITLDAGTPLGPVISHALVSSELTAPLPFTWSAPALSAWRDRGGQVMIHDGAVEWGPLTLDGAGELSLDMNLRPEGVLDIRVRDYEAALDAFANEGFLRDEQLPAIKLALAFISRRPTPADPPEVRARLELADGWLNLGPFRLAPLAAVVPK